MRVDNTKKEKRQRERRSKHIAEIHSRSRDAVSMQQSTKNNDDAGSSRAKRDWLRCDRHRVLAVLQALLSDEINSTRNDRSRKKKMMRTERRALHLVKTGWRGEEFRRD